MWYIRESRQVLGLDLHQWHTLYTDLPSRQQKVAVPDKAAVTCSEDETAVVRPQALQDDLVVRCQCPVLVAVKYCLQTEVKYLGVDQHCNNYTPQCTGPEMAALD
jgi:hypothetical protein